MHAGKAPAVMDRLARSAMGMRMIVVMMVMVVIGMVMIVVVPGPW